MVIEAYLASTRDPVLREQMMELIGDFRAAVSTSLARSGHPHPDIAAVTLLAVLDGLTLHKGLDPEIPLNDAAALISEFFTPEPKGLSS